MNIRTYQQLVLGIFLITLLDPLGLHAESLDSYVQRALEEDQEIRRLTLAKEITQLRNSQEDLSTRIPWSLSTGSSGIRWAPTASGSTLAGSPSSTINLGPEGLSSISLSAPFTWDLSESNPSATQISPALSLSHTLEDIRKTGVADPQDLQRAQADLSQEQTLAQRRATVLTSLYSALESVLKDEQTRLAAMQTLADTGLERRNLVQVQGRLVTSLQVLQLDDEIAAAEFDVLNARASQEIVLERIIRITGDESLRVEDILALEIPDPRSFTSLSLPYPSSYTSVALAQLNLGIQESLLAQALEPNPRNLTLSARGETTLKESTTTDPSFGVFGSATYTNPDTWSVGLEVGYQGGVVDGPVVAFVGSWSPGPKSANSEFDQLSRAIAALSAQQSRLSYEGSVEDSINSARDYESQLRQLELSKDSWLRRLAIAQASLTQTETSRAAGLTTPTELEKAQLNLRSSEIQGKIVALQYLNFLQTVERNTL